MSKPDGGRARKLSLHRIFHREVAAVFHAYPQKVKPIMRHLRSLIIETAAMTDGVGALEETLKWGEPSYLPLESNIGSTVRIDWKAKDPENVAIFFKCTTDLVPCFKKRFKETFTYEGNRSILLNLEYDIPEKELQLCFALAFTYHKNKRLPPALRWKFIDDSLNL